jgi:dienelactone hydrolase
MKYLPLILCLVPLVSPAQKKPLDHSVYDGWQSIGERMISNNGKWVVYTVTPQEGDATLYIQSSGSEAYKKSIARGYNAVITEDSRFAVFKIKPLYQQTREARIRKKKPEEMPKDSMGIVELGKDQVWWIASVKSFKVPEKGSGWVAYQKEKDPALVKSPTATQRTVDSLRRVVDSLRMLVPTRKNIKGGNADETDAEGDPAAGGDNNEGSDLVLRNLYTGKERVLRNAGEYAFNKYGQKLALTVLRPKEGWAGRAVVVVDLKTGGTDTVLKGGNDFRTLTLNEQGSQLAFLAERDTNTKVLQKFYGLYLYHPGSDSADLVVDKKTPGMNLGTTVSENSNLHFSKSGKRLFLGTAAVQPPKDTTLVDFESARLDIWNYKDDYLQSQQLFQLPLETKRSYLATFDLAENKLVPLGSPGLPTIYETGEGDGDRFVGVTDTGRRVELQWTGETKKDVYDINVRTGKRTLVWRNLEGTVYPSSTGAYILLYDQKKRNYFIWDGSSLHNATASIKMPLYNEEHDTPGEPEPYGPMGWGKGDSLVYVYDRYDIWQLDPRGKAAPVRITSGRPGKVSYRYVRINPEERFIANNERLHFKLFNQTTKYSTLGYGTLERTGLRTATITTPGPFGYNLLLKARDADIYLYLQENFTQSPDLYTVSVHEAKLSQPAAVNWTYTGGQAGTRLSALNPQQAEYNWGTAELYHWSAIDGKPASGTLYKPEDFDSTKKYPLILYFYERLTDSIFKYQAPAPTPSRLNIPFFVSRGYLVLTPDIVYSKGHPGNDAYNYVVSGAQSLAKKRWVDAQHMGIQGQSWGGYQVAYLVTRTSLFRAAWAGAPVVNMFSAYGGIRWESGVNRQMQYEKGQSRIGATPWERPDLYIENSPLFHLQKVTTPLVIMSNDADGAVPWYQGLEFFTDMRRLGKKVWLLNYNGEAHNLVERRNRKDIQIREQQYFDWLLKGAPPARWLTQGVPAVKKGKDWGLDLAPAL